MKVADRIKVANQLTLKWEDYPGLAPYVITRILQGGRERQKSQNQRNGSMKRPGPMSLALKVEEEGHEPRNAGGKICGQNWKEQGIDFPLEPGLRSTSRSCAWSFPLSCFVSSGRARGVGCRQCPGNTTSSCRTITASFDFPCADRVLLQSISSSISLHQPGTSVRGDDFCFLWGRASA